MIENQINDALSDLCDGRVHPLYAGEKAQAPFIVYTPVSNVKKDTLCGTAESNNTIQIDVYHDIYDELLILKDNIINKLESLPIFNINSTQSYESETRLYRIMIEIKIID